MEIAENGKALSIERVAVAAPLPKQAETPNDSDDNDSGDNVDGDNEEDDSDD